MLVGAWQRRTVDRNWQGMTRTVLVVDDEPNILLSLEFIMKQAGFDVRVARDGNEAIEAFEASIPDLVLMIRLMRSR